MKIAITGTHGTGKTTLAYKLTGYLKAEGYNATMIEECASQCPLGINEKGTLESQIWIISKQLTEELEKGAKYDILVCDRAIIDNYVYTLDVCNREKRKMPKWIALLVNYHIQTYDLLFKTQITNKELKEDGVRSIAPEWQQLIEEIFVETLKKKKIKYFEIPKENQLEFVIEKFREYEKSKSKDKTNRERFTVAKICN